MTNTGINYGSPNYGVGSVPMTNYGHPHQQTHPQQYVGGVGGGVVPLEPPPSYGASVGNTSDVNNSGPVSYGWNTSAGINSNMNKV